jgi:hypothetical protein
MSAAHILTAWLLLSLPLSMFLGSLMRVGKSPRV